MGIWCLIITVIPIPGPVTMLAPGGQGEGVFNTRPTHGYGIHGMQLASLWRRRRSSIFQRYNIEIFVFKMWVQFISPFSLDKRIHYFSTSPHLLRLMNSLKIFKMWVQFISPFSLDKRIHYFSTSPRLLRSMNSLYWNHLAFRDHFTFVLL